MSMSKTQTPILLAPLRRLKPLRRLAHAAVTLPMLVAITGVGIAAAPVYHTLGAQAAPQTERPVPFDSVGRVTVMTPTLASRFALRAPLWPVTGAFREARLFRSGERDHVIVVTRADGSLTRYPLTTVGVTALRQAVETAVQSQGALLERGGGGGDAVVSAPAGNEFVRNQTILGLVAYGPSTAALLSEAGGAAAATGYLVAAGASFFASANLVKYRTVTRAQASLASHGGFRGALAGLAVARIADASGGPSIGAPVLTGALGGTLGGYQFARGLSDGESAASGLGADLAALTTLGLGGAAGAFSSRTVQVFDVLGRPIIREERSLRGSGKAVLGAAIGAAALGYALGPRYARRAEYNVTAGDAKVAFAASLLGASGAFGVLGDNAGEEAGFGVATAGLLAGFLVADRALVRTADRTASDGTLIQLGTLAGALIGGGVAAATEANGQVAALMITSAGALGLLASDRIVAAPRDAGPLRGITSSGANASASASRVEFSPSALAMALAFTPRGAGRMVDGVLHLPLTNRPVSTPIPVLRIAW